MQCAAPFCVPDLRAQSPGPPSLASPAGALAAPAPLTKVLVFFVGWGVAGLTDLAALGGVALPRARGPRAVHMVLAGGDGVGPAAWRAKDKGGCQEEAPRGQREESG